MPKIEEEWKFIEGSNEKYKVSNLGRKLGTEVVNHGVNGLFKVVDGNIWKYEKI